MTERELERVTSDLETCERVYRESVRHADELRLARNTAVERALRTGLRQARIAEITGLSRQRIQQLKPVE